MADAAKALGKPDAAGAVAKVVTGMMGNGMQGVVRSA